MFSVGKALVQSPAPNNNHNSNNNQTGLVNLSVELKEESLIAV